MNNRQKMHFANSMVRKKLKEYEFEHFYFFPHLRWMKDWTFDGCGFDMVGWKRGRKRICLFQIKTNCKMPKKELEKYYIIEQKYYCKCFWVNKVKGKIIAYGPEIPLGKVL